jgi:hypothetical protein
MLQAPGVKMKMGKIVSDRKAAYARMARETQHEKSINCNQGILTRGKGSVQLTSLLR